jgi:hypothetical protein
MTGLWLRIRALVAIAAAATFCAAGARGADPVLVQITRTGGTGSFSVPVFFGALSSLPP